MGHNLRQYSVLYTIFIKKPHVILYLHEFQAVLLRSFPVRETSVPACPTPSLSHPNKPYSSNRSTKPRGAEALLNYVSVPFSNSIHHGRGGWSRVIALQCTTMCDYTIKHICIVIMKSFDIHEKYALCRICFLVIRVTQSVGQLKEGF